MTSSYAPAALANDPRLTRAAELVTDIGLSASENLESKLLLVGRLPLPEPTSNPDLALKVLSAASDLIDFGSRWLQAGGDGLVDAEPETVREILASFESMGPPRCTSSVTHNLTALAGAGVLRSTISELVSATVANDPSGRKTALTTATNQSACNDESGLPRFPHSAPMSSKRLDAWLRYLEATHALHRSVNQVESDSMTAFLSALRGFPEARLVSVGADLRTLYDVWIKANEEAYDGLLRSKRYPLLLGELVNAASALKLACIDDPASERPETARRDLRPSAAGSTTDSRPVKDRNSGESLPQESRSSPAPELGVSRAHSRNAELRVLEKDLRKVLEAIDKKDDISIGFHDREIVARVGGTTLYRYRPHASRRPGRALLIVYALVNRPDMIDLEEDRSLIGGFLRAGLDVYLVDWGYPSSGDRRLSLDDYVLDHLDRCVNEVLDQTGRDEVDLLGICQGGLLALCYSALRPGKVRALVTMVTPADFSTKTNKLARLAREIDVDQLVAAFGNVPGELLSAIFVSLSPFRLGSQKYLRLMDLLDDPPGWRNFLRMEHWIFDSPDQAGGAFGQFFRAFVQENGLIKGKIVIGGERVDLGRVSMPILNVYATQDHLVPQSCAKALGRYVGSCDYTEHAFAGGHIGVYVSRRAQRQISPRIASWLLER